MVVADQKILNANIRIITNGMALKRRRCLTTFKELSLSKIFTCLQISAANLF